MECWCTSMTGSSYGCHSIDLVPVQCTAFPLVHCLCRLPSGKISSRIQRMTPRRRRLFLLPARQPPTARHMDCRSLIYLHLYMRAPYVSIKVNLSTGWYGMALPMQDSQWRRAVLLHSYSAHDSMLRFQLSYTHQAPAYHIAHMLQGGC